MLFYPAFFIRADCFQIEGMWISFIVLFWLANPFDESPLSADDSLLNWELIRSDDRINLPLVFLLLEEQKLTALLIIFTRIIVWL